VHDVVVPDLVVEGVVRGWIAGHGRTIADPITHECEETGPPIIFRPKVVICHPITGLNLAVMTAPVLLSLSGSDGKLAGGPLPGGKADIRRALATSANDERTSDSHRLSRHAIMNK
jgi:hypothetical protein